MKSGKSQDQQQMALVSSIGEIRRVVEANQLKLQHMELAVANLTCICNALKTDNMYCSNQGSFRKVEADAMEIKPPSSTRSSSPGLEIKDSTLNDQMQQLVEQAAALGILKEKAKTTHPNKISGNMRPNPKSPPKSTLKNVQATKGHQKMSTRAVVQTTKSTTEKKMSLQLGPIKNKNNMGGATHQPKGPQKNAVINNINSTTTAKLSLKSTIKRMKTTISEVYVESNAKTSKQMERVNVLKKSSSFKGKGGLVKLKVKANQVESSQHEKSDIPTMTKSVSGKSVPKPRRRWSTSKEITLKK